MTQLHRVTGLRAYYPDTGRQGKWHRPLYESLARGERGVLDALRHELEALENEVDIVILSYEELYKLDSAQIRWIVDGLPDLTALVFLRRQDQLINSFHNQLHKSHRVSLRELEAFERRMLEYNSDYDHRRTLERWTGVLGRGAVQAILFDRDASPAVAFFRHAGLQLELDGFAEAYPNRAVNDYGLAVFRWVKRLVQDDVWLPEVMAEAHRRLAQHFVAADDRAERYSLTLDDRLELMAHYAESNEWVRSEFFPDHSVLFAPLEADKPVAPDYRLGRDLAEAIIATTMVKR